MHGFRRITRGRPGDREGPLPRLWKKAREKTSGKRFEEFREERGLLGLGQVRSFEDMGEEEEALLTEDEKKRRDREEEEKKTPEGRRRRWKRRFRYLSRFYQAFHGKRWQIVLLLLISGATILSRAALPWSAKIMIDYILPSGNPAGVWAAVGVLFVLGVISVSAALSQNFLTRRLLGSFVTQMRRRLMKHLLRMPLHRLQQMKVGGIVSRLQSDTEMMRGLLQEGLITPLNAILMFGVALVSLTILSWRIMLVWLVFTGMLFGIAYILFRIMKPFQKALREELAAISAHATEVFAGMNVVRAFVRERAEGRVYAGATHLLWRKSLLAGDLNALAHQGVRTIFWLLHISMWLIGGLQHIHDPAALPLGSLVAFISFVTWLFMPIFMIMGSLATLQVSMACAERVFDLLDEPVGMPDAPDAVDVPDFEREIRFETVSFDYPDGTRALDRLDLRIPRGKVTALVGPSGAGKSTVVNLVLRFYDATEGEILLDGTDIRRYTLASYRRLMSLVLQDVFLFDGTVRENITYGNPDASDEEVHEAARVANAHEFIVQLDRGYDAYVGERGVKLSGGQKQRIALARAVLTNPEILVLDEATSNLDAESEALIQDALRRIFRERTTLVIAHRLSTILDADNIAVLDGGRKIEEGSHEALLAKKGRYHDLYTRQMMQAEDATTFDWGGE